jgi:hypothetical protein
MDFQADDFGDLQRFAEQLTNIVQMRKQSLGIDVTFPAVGDVSVEGERVVNATGLGASLGNELRSQSLERREFSVLDLEVRNKGAASVGYEHRCLLS